MHKQPDTTYSAAGVDTDREDEALDLLGARVAATWPKGGGTGTVKLPLGYFANIIEVQGLGIAITTDGIGTKALIAQMLHRYDTVGIDCVASNVNDLLCVGAKPISMVDYLAVQVANPELMDEIAKGLTVGALQAGVSISGGETAQLREIIKGQRDGYGFDLAGTAIGIVPLDRILIGQDIRDGDAIIGIESNGIHCNGLTLARRALFETGRLAIDEQLSSIRGSLGEELLQPSHIYVREVLQLLEQDIAVKALIHITSDGYLNLIRVKAEVGYVLDKLPAIPGIFQAIQQYGGISDEEMFRVFNMGVGFCVIVAPESVEHALKIISSHGKHCWHIGRAVPDVQRRVRIPEKRLVGTNNHFVREP